MASNTKKSASSSKSTNEVKKAAKKSESAAKSSTSKAATSTSKSTPQSSGGNAGQGKQVKLTKSKLYKFIGGALLVILVIFLLDLVVQYINNDYSAARVNGERISQSDFEERMTEIYGDTVITLMINETLIIQEAEAEGVTVEESEVDELVEKTIEELGGQDQFESALNANGLTEEAYRRNLEIQLTAEKLIVEEPTDEELKAFFNENKEVYFEAEAVYEDVKDDVKDIYRTQKFNELSPAWLAQLQEDSDVQNNISDPQDYGAFMTIRNWLTSLNDRLEDSEE